jgi:hypothetical protein
VGVQTKIEIITIKKARRGAMTSSRGMGILIKIGTIIRMILWRIVRQMKVICAPKVLLRGL